MTQPTDPRASAVARVEIFDAWRRLLAVAERTATGSWHVRAGGRLVVAETRVAAVLTAVTMADDGPADPANRDPVDHDPADHDPDESVWWRSYWYRLGYRHGAAFARVEVRAVGLWRRLWRRGGER